MKLAIDVMGFENDITHAINACVKFQKKFPNVDFLLVGKKDLIQAKIKQNSKIVIIDAQDVIKMDDNPLLALRKINSSMYQAINLVATNQADGVLSAGSTNCYVAMVFNLLKKINGINKIGFMPFIPTVINNGFNLIDVGANKECEGIDLYNYALMASVYCKLTRNIDKPRVGIVNIGTEENKGFDFQKEGFKLLKKDSTINFVGYVEPRELLNGIVDIAVCDGYTGNITLKSMEGGLKSLKTALKNQYKKPWNWLGALFSLFAIKSVSKTFDYRNNAGAMVVGVQKVAFKTHGSADMKQFYSSIRMMYETINKKVIDQIKQRIANE